MALFTALRQREKGFTLLELLVAIAILAIVASVAVPGFAEVIRQNRATTLANDMVSALNLARSEAVKRNTQVSVSPSGERLSRGWQVITEDNEVLRRWPGRDDAELSANVTSVSYNARGRVVGSAGIVIDIAFQDAQRCVLVSLSGSARVAAEREGCNE